jgi:LuxR family maltose regulon positive regulatory protein
MLAGVEQTARRLHFERLMPELATGQILALLQQGNLTAAARLAEEYDLPFCQARVHLARGDPAAALAELEPARRQAEAKSWQDERLKAMVLQALALQAHGEKDRAAGLLGEALALAEPGGFIRIFLDEGALMAQLLSETADQGIMPGYAARLLAGWEAEAQASQAKSGGSPAQPLIEPLSPRELEVLRLIAQGLSNQEISARLFLAVDTVKGHNRRIYDKLGVQRRTEAVARARELGLL